MVPLSVLPSWMSEFERWSPRVGVEGHPSAVCEGTQPSSSPPDMCVPARAALLLCRCAPRKRAAPRAAPRPQMRVVRLHTTDAGERARIKREVLSQPSSFDVAVTTYDMCRVSDAHCRPACLPACCGASVSGGGGSLRWVGTWARTRRQQLHASSVCRAASISGADAEAEATPRMQSKEWGRVLSRLLRWRYLVLDEVRRRCGGAVLTSSKSARGQLPQARMEVRRS